MLISCYELRPDICWHEATAAIVRYLWPTTDHDALDGICFALGRIHPVYQSLAGWLRQVNCDAPLYVRIPNLVTFLRHITLVLEMRLAKSALAGYTGPLTIVCGHEAIYFSFNTGSLINVESGYTVNQKQDDAAFPHQIFLQLLFGLRSQVELEKPLPSVVSIRVVEHC